MDYPKSIVSNQKEESISTQKYNHFLNVYVFLTVFLNSENKHKGCFILNTFPEQYLLHILVENSYLVALENLGQRNILEMSRIPTFRL